MSMKPATSFQNQWVTSWICPSSYIVHISATAGCEFNGGYYQSCRCRRSWRGSGRVCVLTATWGETVAATTLWPPGTARNTLCSLTAIPAPSPSCSQRPQCCEEPETASGVLPAYVPCLVKSRVEKKNAFLTSVCKTCNACSKSSVCAAMCSQHVRMRVLRLCIKRRFHLKKRQEYMFLLLFFQRWRSEMVVMCLLFDVDGSSWLRDYFFLHLHNAKQSLTLCPCGSCGWALVAPDRKN